MKINAAILVFPGSTGADDIKTACDYHEWKADLIWHKDCINSKYDIIFVSPGNPYENRDYQKEYLYETSNVMKNLPYTKTLIVGFSDGFQILCKADMIKGHLEKNIANQKYSGYKMFSFLDNDILLPVFTEYGNFVKNSDFNHDVILKYHDENISDNNIAGVYDYENKVIGMVANPHLAINSKLRQIEGRKVFNFIRNVI